MPNSPTPYSAALPRGARSASARSAASDATAPQGSATLHSTARHDTTRHSARRHSATCRSTKYRPTSRRKRSALTALLGAALSGAFGAPSASAQGALIEQSITPLSTEPASSGWPVAHFVCWDPNLAARDELFVFLHGLDGAPASCKNLIRTAARDGYRSIGLSYPCSWVPFQFCNDSTDPDCYEDLRREIFEGVDYSPWISVPPADALEHRLVKLLEYLASHEPTQPWASFLDGDKPRWSSIVLYGHSQGGSNAALVARHRVVARAILSAPPADFSQALGAYAPWWSSHATPTDAYFGFVHAQDGLASKLAAWSLIGIAPYGPPVDVAQHGAPFCFTHELQSSVAPALAGQFHNSVATDATTPLGANGKPVYEPVWRYLISGGEHADAPQLSTDVATISAQSGGAQTWCVNAGVAHASDWYWIVGSVSGTQPGFDVGGVHVQLNVDAWTLVTLTQPNQGALSGSLGQLDAQGRASGALVLPPASGALIGVHADHACALLDAWTLDAVSAPVGVTVVP